MKGALLGLMFFSVCVHAELMGVYGPVYPIQETDFLTLIHQRLVKAEALHWKQAFQQRVAKRLERPAPVEGITETRIKRTWLFDPSVVLTRPLKDNRGHLIAKAGTRINPLDFVSLRHPLLFFSGDSEVQRQWALRMGQMKKEQGGGYILIAGSIPVTERYLNKRVYFDQGGRLIKHFHIQHTPAIVTQAGRQLKIEEVVA